MKYIIGVENTEVEWPFNVMAYRVFVGIMIQVLGMVDCCRETRFYEEDDIRRSACLVSDAVYEKENVDFYKNPFYIGPPGSFNVVPST